MELAIGLALLAFISVFVLFFGIDRTLGSHSQLIESRLDRYASRPLGEAAQPTTAGQRSRVGPGLDRVLLVGSNTKQIATDLARADLRLTPSEFVLINISAVFAGFVAVYFFSRGNLILSLVGAIVGFYLPRFYVRHLQSRRLNAFNNQLGDTLVQLANSLRSGYSLLQSMETVSKEFSPPMSLEFARVVREIGLGLTIEESLSHLVQRINSDDLDMVVTAINIQHEVGGNLAEILDTIAHTIRERVRIKGHIRSITSTQRMSGNVISLLPVAVGLFLLSFNPNYISNMWQEPCGIVMLIIGATTIALGYFAIRKIMNIEV